MIYFDAEEWLYERKNAYPMVECVKGSATGLWRNFIYHPEFNGQVLQHGDLIDTDMPPVGATHKNAGSGLYIKLNDDGTYCSFVANKWLDEAVELIIERDERIQILENRLKEYEKENR